MESDVTTTFSESTAFTKKQLNRYVKVKGHENWFLVLEAQDSEPDGLSETMQERMMRSQICTLHNPNATMDYVHRIKLTAVRDIDYESLAQKYGTILIRPIGSFMLMKHNEITNETFDYDFPVEDFADIVICENDEKAEYDWIKYLEKRFPNQKILTINYFDLRSENEVEKFFKRAKYITFSTTFSNLDWFKKLSKFSNDSHKIIGYCHVKENWEEALLINNNVEVVKQIN